MNGSLLVRMIHHSINMEDLSFGLLREHMIGNGRIWVVENKYDVYAFLLGNIAQINCKDISDLNFSLFKKYHEDFIHRMEKTD